MIVLVFVAAVASIVWAGLLEPNSLARNLLSTAWIIAPYLVLTTVAVISERRTSLLATAVATLLGGCGALVSVGLMTVFEGVDDRFIPLFQAGAIAVLVPAYKWLMARIDVNSPLK